MREFIDLIESQQVELTLDRYERASGEWWINIMGSDGKHYGMCHPNDDGTFTVAVNVFHPKTGANLGTQEKNVAADQVKSVVQTLFNQARAKLPGKQAPQDRPKAPAYDGNNETDILNHHSEEDTKFSVLHHDATRHDAETPLVIVVHPGDLIQTADGFDWREGKKAKAFSDDNQTGTAEELAHWREQGFDIVVLHRQSCTYMSQGESDEAYRSEVLSAWDNGSALYGDDLGEAAKWIIDNLHVAERPHIYLAGAYSTPGNGCLTYIGKAIEKVVGEDRITVSDFSPPGNAPAKVWRPGNRSVRFWDAQGDGWRKTPKGKARK